MKISKSAVLPVAVALVLAGAACSSKPSDERPTEPKPIRTKYIDPASKTCAKYKKSKCVKYKTDDKDWVIVTTDGNEYDVEEDEYNSVDVNGRWPSQ